MFPEKPHPANWAAELARRMSEALVRERYVVDNGRQALQVHAAMYRDLLALLQREALLACCVRVLEIVGREPRAQRRSQPRPMGRREAALFRKKFLASLVRQQGWTAGDALDFQRDLRMYEELLARAAAGRRTRKPYEVANHPFVDRCAVLLDSSFLEKARIAASLALRGIERLAATITEPATTVPSGRSRS